MGTPRKINAILLNIKTNQPKLVIMCRYKLATYWQNFTEICLTRVKISQKVLGGLLFLTHTVYVLVQIPAVVRIHKISISISQSMTLKMSLVSCEPG